MRRVNVVAYPKSGSHLTQHLLRAAGIESTHSHELGRWGGVVDLHVMRDIRAIVPSAVCHYVLERPERDPDLIRPHCLEMATAMRGDWKRLGFCGWSDYVEQLHAKAGHTVAFADLVARPREALKSLVDIGALAAGSMAYERRVLGHMDPEFAWKSKFKFRGGPGWLVTLGDELAEEIAGMFRPGLELLERIRLSVIAP